MGIAECKGRTVLITVLVEVPTGTVLGKEGHAVVLSYEGLLMPNQRSPVRGKINIPLMGKDRLGLAWLYVRIRGEAGTTLGTAITDQSRFGRAHPPHISHGEITDNTNLLLAHRRHLSH